MLDTILSSTFFGLTLSAAAWCIGCWAQKKTGLLLCNPLLVAGGLGVCPLAGLPPPHSGPPPRGGFF